MSTPVATARRTLTDLTMPSRRAIVGGLLIAVAATLAFVGATSHGGASHTTVVVARHPLGIGQTIGADDLGTMSVTLDRALADHGFTTASALIGATALAPVGEGELVQRSSVRAAGSSGSGPARFSFPIDRERALDGQLRPGDTVEVLGTYGSGIDSRTEILARGATIDQIDESKSSSVTGGSRLILTASFLTSDELLDVAHAAQVAAITLVHAPPGAAGSRRSATGPLPSALSTPEQR